MFTPRPAEDVVREAIAAFGPALGPGGAAERLRGEATFRGHKADVEHQFGRDDIGRTYVSARNHKFTFTCMATTSFQAYDGRVHESRGRSFGCVDTMPEAPLLFPFFTTEPEENWRIVNATRHGAIVTARIERVDGSALANVQVGASGRISQFSVSGPEGRSFIDVSYGRRGMFDAPTATDRVPHVIRANQSWEGNMFSWIAVDHDAAAPLSDFEVRVVDQRGGGDVLAAFALNPGELQDGVFRFRFHDSGDGLFGADDRFFIWPDAGAASGVSIVVWDLWADKPVTTSNQAWHLGVPFPVAWFLLALVASAWLRPRRPAITTSRP